MAVDFQCSISSTCIELYGWERNVPALAKLPLVDSAEDCVYMAYAVTLKDGELPVDKVSRFWSRLRQVLAHPDLPFTGRFGTPLFISALGNSKGLLCVYLKSSKTMEELNTRLGQIVFRPEGGMYHLVEEL